MTPPKDPRFKQLRPVLGAKIDALEAAYLAGTPAERQEIDIVLELLRRQATDRWSALLDPPSGDAADGPIRLGRVRHGRATLGRIGLELGEALQHTLIVGRSGAGKSNLVHHILCQLMDRGIAWLVTDSKRSTRDLAALPGRESIRVASLGRDFGAMLRFNPLDPPPGIPFDAHIRRVVELICDTYTGGDGVRQLLTGVIERLHDHGNTIPNLSDAKEAIRRSADKGRTGQWRITTLRILDHLTSGPLGRVLTSARSSDAIGQLSAGQTILELDGLPRQDASLVVQLILRALHQRLLASNTREKLRFVVCLEEAQDLAPRRDGARETIVETTMRQARESGMGMLLASQSPSTLSPVVLSNCYSVLSLNLRSRTDISAASHALLLDQDGAAMLSSLPVGQAICRMSGRWPRPVHLQIPPVEVPKGALSDRDVMARFVSGPLSQSSSKGIAPSLPIRNAPTGPAGSADANHLAAPAYAESGLAAPPNVSGVSGPSGDSGVTGGTRRKTPPIEEQAGIPGRPLADGVPEPGHSGTASGDARTDERIEYGSVDPFADNPLLGMLLRDIAKNPCSVVSERYDRLRLSRRKGNAAKRALADLGLIAATPTPVPEGRVVLLSLTETGRLWCVRHRVSVTPLHGGIEHEYWKHRAGEILSRRGWSVRLEHEIDGHRFDVHAKRNGKALILECETGRSDYVSNIDHLQRADAAHKAVLWIRPGTLLEALEEQIAPIELLRPVTLERWIRSVSA